MGAATLRRLPHFARRGAEIFFLASRRPHLRLDDDDARLFDSIDGRALSSLGERECATVERWREAGIVVLVPEPAAGRVGHVVVVEPHMDDAALSLGGVLLKKRAHQAITLVTVVARSTFTSYTVQDRPFGDVDVVSKLRAAEAAIAAETLGASHRIIGEDDALLRFLRANALGDDASLSTIEPAARAWMRFGPTAREVSDLAEAIERILRERPATELWFPLAVGDHVDHVRTRDACLSVVRRAPSLADSVYLYTDLPYASRHPEQAERIAAALGLEREVVDITDVFEEKLALVNVYASQGKPSFIAPRLARVAEAAASSKGRRAETIHRLGHHRFPAPPARALVHEAARVETLRGALAAWSADARVAVVADVPLGDEVRLLARLRAAFGDAVRARASEVGDATHVLAIGAGPVDHPRVVHAQSAGDVVLALD